jgi:hypothetical protein
MMENPTKMDGLGRVIINQWKINPKSSKSLTTMVTWGSPIWHDTKLQPG